MVEILNHQQYPGLTSYMVKITKRVRRPGRPGPSRTGIISPLPAPLFRISSPQPPSRRVGNNTGICAETVRDTRHCSIFGIIAHSTCVKLKSFRGPCCSSLYGTPPPIVSVCSSCFEQMFVKFEIIWNFFFEFGIIVLCNKSVSRKRCSVVPAKIPRLTDALCQKKMFTSFLKGERIQDEYISVSRLPFKEYGGKLLIRPACTCNGGQLIGHFSFYFFNLLKFT